MAVLVVLLSVISLTALTKLGLHAPWSPIMNAWSSTSDS